MYEEDIVNYGAKIIKVIALTTTHQYLISEIEEVAAVDIGEPDCKLTILFINTTELF